MDAEEDWSEEMRSLGGRKLGERATIARRIAERFNITEKQARYLRLAHSNDGISTRLDLISADALQVLINSLKWDGRARRVKR